MTDRYPRPSHAQHTDRRIWIVIAVVVGGVIVVNLLAQDSTSAVGARSRPVRPDRRTPPPRGGLAAFTALLAHYDHDVTQARGAIAQNPPPPDSTVFVIEPSGADAR